MCQCVRVRVCHVSVAHLIGVVIHQGLHVIQSLDLTGRCAHFSLVLQRKVPIDQNTYTDFSLQRREFAFSTRFPYHSPRSDLSDFAAVSRRKPRVLRTEPNLQEAEMWLGSHCIIHIEGLDGSGKTTLIPHLVEALLSDAGHAQLSPDPSNCDADHQATVPGEIGRAHV